MLVPHTGSGSALLLSMPQMYAAVCGVGLPGLGWHGACSRPSGLTEVDGQCGCIKLISLEIQSEVMWFGKEEQLESIAVAMLQLHLQQRGRFWILFSKCGGKEATRIN